MNEKLNQEWISAAMNGDSQALEYILVEVKDFIFNLSLRMLGVVPDAEDATQDILIKVITNLSSFRQDSAFTTWVYRIAVNHLIDYKKSMFVDRPLNFEFYANEKITSKRWKILMNRWISSHQPVIINQMLM